jgi:ribosomal-protein-alanine N-acetyltransferase
MIGTVGFVSFSLKQNSAEIGYALHPDYWGQSITPEAVWAVLRFGFVTLGLHRIEARFMVENIQSRRVMEKVGMRFEGVLREGMKIKERYRDIGVCSVLAKDFVAR